MQTKHESNKTKSQKIKCPQKKGIGKSNKEKHIAMKEIITSVSFNKRKKHGKA